MTDVFGTEIDADSKKRGHVRVATFNAALNRNAPDALIDDLSTGDDEQARMVAETIQRVDPDIVLLNEVDYDENLRAIRLLKKNYLEIGQNGTSPVFFGHAFAAAVNTGVPSGFDLDKDGRTDGPGDAFGFGLFPGQYGMALLSKFPVSKGRARTFQRFPWKDMPGNLIPPEYYTEDELCALRLSSKSHWDIPANVNGTEIHLLCSHPTPPVYDGEERRNARRNHDEIRFWADYVAPGRGSYIRDDNGSPGGLPPSAPFVILGDLNADPEKGDGLENAARQLLENAAVDSSFIPESEGAAEQSGDSKNTASWGLRVDYVLPSKAGFQIESGGVFWPAESDPLHRLVKDDICSDHRLVWLDLTVVSSRSVGWVGGRGAGRFRWCQACRSR